MQSTIKMVLNEGKRRMAVIGFGITYTEAVRMELLGASVAAHLVFSVIISANLAEIKFAFFLQVRFLTMAI